MARAPDTAWKAVKSRPFGPLGAIELPWKSGYSSIHAFAAADKRLSQSCFPG